MKRAILCFIALCIFQQASAITYPQLALGGGYKCILLVSNKKDFKWEGAIFLREGNDLAWSGNWSANGRDLTGFSSFSFTLPGKGSRKFILEGDSQLRAGYLELRGQSGFSTSDVVVSFFYNFILEGELVDSTGVLPASPDDEFVFPVEKDVKVNTGLAWVAWLPSIFTSPFEIAFTLYDSEGNLVQKKSLEYQGHSALFFDEVFDNVPDSFRGMIIMQSQEWMYLTVLRLEFTSTGFQLTSVPAGDLFLFF
ncbi:hypothetical protein MYX84_07095 [Acidobacteria bacterium AH-259-O06]|nr:hypothetical protein [Acidobacteria bacterium AH-259-O06]